MYQRLVKVWHAMIRNKIIILKYMWFISISEVKKSEEVWITLLYTGIVSILTGM